jgi:hypothetical protein
MENVDNELQTANQLFGGYVGHAVCMGDYPESTKNLNFPLEYNLFVEFKKGSFNYLCFNLSREDNIKIQLSTFEELCEYLKTSNWKLQSIVGY